MLSLLEYHPAFLGFAEICSGVVEGEIGLAEFAPNCSAFSKFLERLQRRLNWELPLIESCCEATCACEPLVQSVQELSGRLFRGCPAQEAAGPLLEQVKGCLGALYRVQDCFEQLPTFTEISVLNEILLLVAQDPPPAGETLALRLPMLLDWLRDLEDQWSLFAELFPAQLSLSEQIQLILRAFQAAAGGLHLYTQGDAEPVLVEASKLLKTALEELVCLEQQRLEIESDHLGKTGDLTLSRGLALLQIRSRLPESYGRVLLGWVSEKQGQLLMLRTWNQLSPQHSQAGLRRLQSELDECTRRVRRPADDPAALLQRLERWRLDFEALSEG